MKNGSNFIILRVQNGDVSEELQVDTQELKEVLKKLNKEDYLSDLELSFKYNDEILKVHTTVPDIRKLIKQTEMTKHLIPLNLRVYLEDLTQQFATKEIRPIKGRETEIEKIWFYLSQKRRNNVFLVGQKDVGKTAIACEIARQVSTNECPKEFYDTRVIMLRPKMLLKIKNKGVYEHVVKKIITFLVKHKDNIILYIDKSIYMKTDELLILMLYKCITKYNIRLITTSSEENFDDYFAEDQVISKYLNYIYVEEPELEELKPMIKDHILRLQKEYKIKIPKNIIDFGIFTSELSDSISANPGKVINNFERAFLEAKRKDKELVDKESILSCYNTRLKEYNKLPKERKLRVAYHETGHYILAVKNKYLKDIKISCVSNLPMQQWGGVTMKYFNVEDCVARSKEYYIDYIALYLGGGIAERKFTNVNSDGVLYDLKEANRIARAMVMKWGLSEYKSNQNRQYDLEYYYLMPEKKKQSIDEEIEAIIEAATKRAEEVIEENEELLKIIAEKLFEEEVLTGEQLKAICNEYQNNKDE